MHSVLQLTHPTFWPALQGAVITSIKQSTLADMSAPAAAAGHTHMQQQRPKEHQNQGSAGGTWQELLWNALTAAAPATTFACSGKLSQPPAPFPTYPHITVEGVGPLALPLTPDQAASLKTVAEQAPHGRGMRTVVDTAVRDAYQVGLLTCCPECLQHLSWPSGSRAQGYSGSS